MPDQPTKYQVVAFAFHGVWRRCWRDRRTRAAAIVGLTIAVCIAMLYESCFSRSVYIANHTRHPELAVSVQLESRDETRRNVVLKQGETARIELVGFPRHDASICLCFLSVRNVPPCKCFGYECRASGTYNYSVLLTQNEYSDAIYLDYWDFSVRNGHGGFEFDGWYRMLALIKQLSASRHQVPEVP